MFTPQMLLYGLAILILVILLPALIEPKKFRKETLHMVSDRNIVRLVGVIILLISFMFLSVHWKLTDGWMMTISIIGWLFLIGGIFRIWAPRYVKKIMKKMLNSDTHTTASAVIGILIAVALAYVALNLINIGEIVAG